MFIHYRVGFEEKSFPILVNFGEACKINSKKEGKVNDLWSEIWTIFALQQLCLSINY